MTAASAAFGPLLDAATQPAKQSFNPTIFIFLIIGAAFYFLIYRPQQRKQKAARELGNAFEVGDEVVTAGGIVGHVLDITDDRVTLETSVGASFVVLRPYVLRKLEPVVPPSDVVDADPSSVTLAPSTVAVTTGTGAVCGAFTVTVCVIEPVTPRESMAVSFTV